MRCNNFPLYTIRPYLDRRIDDKVDAGDKEGQEPEEPGEVVPPVAAAPAQLEMGDGDHREDGYLDGPRQEVTQGGDGGLPLLLLHH